MISARPRRWTSIGCLICASHDHLAEQHWTAPTEPPSPETGAFASRPDSDPRPGWDDYFLAIATAVASRADCTRRQVGAVLVGPDRRVLSTGYNGAPPGVPGCATAGACPRGRQDTTAVPSRTSYADGAGACIAIHAEANAIIYSRPASRAGATMYVTCEPCPPCYALLDACGITDVRWPSDSN